MEVSNCHIACHRRNFGKQVFFQVNQSRHHLTLCTWSGTPPAARVGLFRSLHPRSGRCVKSSSDSFIVHHIVAYDASQSTKIWVLRRFPTNNMHSVNFVHFPIEQMEDIPDSCAHTYIFFGSSAVCSMRLAIPYCFV